jgi:two-component system sensor histidine kinase UhpB
VKKLPNYRLCPSDIDLLNASAVQASREAIIAVDESQTILRINPAAQQMFGCSVAAVLGSPLGQLVTLSLAPALAQAQFPAQVPAPSDTQMQARGASAAGPKAEASIAIYGCHANGRQFPLAATVVSLPPSNHLRVPKLYNVLLSDLSTEHWLSEEVATLRQQLHRIFEVSPTAILLTDGERTVFANPAFLHLLGASNLEQIKGKSVYEFFYSKSRAALQEQITRALTGKLGNGVLSERLRRYDGSLRGVEIAVVALPGMTERTQPTVQLVITDITQRERASEELLHSRQELRRLSGSLVDAREEERRRISRELHDELGQRLSALKMGLTSLGHELHGRASQQRQFDMLKTLDDTVAAVRHLAADLRPLMLDDLGLNAAIEWLARESARRMNLEITVRLDEADPPLGHRVSTALYRMVQEALTNVARHARASKVVIDLTQQDGKVQLTVRDNGIGLPSLTARSETSFGLLGMRERAILLGGQMNIANPPDGGCLVTVSLPTRLTEKLPHAPEDSA